MTDINPDDWTMDHGEFGKYLFVEDENANITGLGHQDLTAFAADVNRYDEAMTGDAVPEDEQWTAGHIAHRWAVLGDDGERLFPATEQTPGAIAITTLWGQR